MREPLGYHVFCGGLWLDADEKTWTRHFSNAASFTDAELAKDIAERETAEGPMANYEFYVFACMPS